MDLLTWLVKAVVVIVGLWLITVTLGFFSIFFSV